MNNEERKYFSSLIGFTFDSDDLKYIEQMINKRNKIIEEAREYIEENSIYYPTSDGCQWVDQFKVLEILDKAGKDNE